MINIMSQTLYFNILNIKKNFFILLMIGILVMCAKYDRSRMNDACTVCPADFVSLPAKVIHG